MTLWSGRVGSELAPEVWAFLKSDDAELLPYDIQGTLLHAERLHAAGILDDAEPLPDVRVMEDLDTVELEHLPRPAVVEVEVDGGPHVAGDVERSPRVAVIPNGG